MNNVFRALHRRLFTISLLLVVAAAGTWSADPAVDPRFAAADTLFLQRADADKARASLALYRAHVREGQAGPDAAWRLSMACYFVGFNIANTKEEKKALFAEGRDAGLYALQRTTVSAEAYFWTAVNMALYGEAAGVVKMLFTLPTVRRYLHASAALDPSYAYGGANRILGKIDESLPGLLGGNRERAAVLYRKAIAAAPDEPLNYLFLARLLAAAGRSSEEALAIARQGAALSVAEPFRFESIQGLQELRQFAARFDQDVKKEGEK